MSDLVTCLLALADVHDRAAQRANYGSAGLPQHVASKPSQVAAAEFAARTRSYHVEAASVIREAVAIVERSQA